MAYLTEDEFKERTIMPGEDLDVIKSLAPTWLARALEDFSSEIDARLRKRYKVPFTAPAPAIVKRWLHVLVTPQAYRKRGVNPSDTQITSVDADAANALAEIKEAADCVAGLFDLPLLDTADGSAIVKAGPLGYSEASPYTWMDVQADAIREGGG